MSCLRRKIAMPAVAKNERLRRLCVESRGRLRVGSQDHASAWRLPDGCFGWRLDADDERAGPGTPRTRTGWRTARASRSAASRTTSHGPTSSTTGHGPSVSTTGHGSSGGTAGHGSSVGAACHGASRRAASHAAATGDGATSGASGAAHRLTATALDPSYQCPPNRPAGGRAPARIPSAAGSGRTSGHGAAADAAYRRPFASKCTPGRKPATGAAA
ncbi:hypothetical protein IQ17_00454 [Bradyrhizobium daqingense]|uniref:Uncharacterized protein n=1 Tax=Bradyrhizobium daqingense TaxID=993502 RepID=A0A562LUK3_9BRAD|nr:hypothetical protein IQ17_00454 [Bradyrhizobium daqingense]